MTSTIEVVNKSEFTVKQDTQTLKELEDEIKKQNEEQIHQLVMEFYRLYPQGIGAAGVAI